MKTLVGDLSRTEALIIEGNRAFSKDIIIKELSWRLDFHLVSHRLAPLSDYPPWLERQIVLGYQHEGFPDVTVKATADTNAHRVFVRVNEGSRYRCGEIRLSGVPSLTNELVRQKIVECLAGVEGESRTKTTVHRTSSSQPRTGNALEGSSDQSVHVERDTKVEGRIWYPNLPASFDAFSHRRLINLITEALGDLGWFRPKFDIHIDPDPARKVAHLHVDMVDAGIQGVIEEIEVTGIRANTREQVLDYLQLATGRVFNANIMTSVSNQLWQSARFLHQELRLQALPRKGQLKLTLDLEELPEASPLSQDFTPKEKAMLKCREWLADWPNRAEDFVCSVQVSNRWICLEGDLVISPSGLGLATRSGPSNRPPELQYAFVANPSLVGFYSAWRQNKHVVKEADGAVEIFLNIGPIPDATVGNRFQMNFGGGFSASREEAPFRIRMHLAPVAFIGGMPEDWIKGTLNNNILTLRTVSDTNEDENEVWLEGQIEADTGRLIQLRGGVVGGFRLNLRSEEGAFARSVREVASATAGHTNCYVAGHSLSSWLGFQATDLVQSPLVERILLEQIEKTFPPERRVEALAQGAFVKLLLAQTRQDLDQQKLTGVFAPLDRLFAAESDDNKPEENFTIPQDFTRANVMELCAAWAVMQADSLLPRNSWAWVLLREAAFVLVNRGQYTQAELDGLLKSDTLGPAGCLGTALLVRRVNPRLSRAFAELGLSRLTAAEFHKDYRVLMQSNGIIGQTLGNGLNLLRDLSEVQVALITTPLKAGDVAFLQRLTRLIRDSSDPFLGETAWPAFEEHWNPTVRRYLEAELSGFLPQVQFLTNATALYERGMKLFSEDDLLRDYEEGVQCFRKAAEQGHAGAQRQLAIALRFGIGLPKDFAEALRWYHKAAEQNEPHAACGLGDMHGQGKGVDMNLDEAAKWYRTELEVNGNCANAEFSLGWITEKQRDLPGAITWYRRAAGDGDPRAQARLGEFLSDGSTVFPPEYLEACQWLMLAVEKNPDRMAEITLRQVKAKLSPEQLKEVQKRVWAIEKRLAAREKEKKKAEKPKRSSAPSGEAAAVQDYSRTHQSL